MKSDVNFPQMGDTRHAKSHAIKVTIRFAESKLTLCSVLREVPGQFFKVRAWNSNNLIEPPMENYDKLDQDIRAELPLKRIWTLVTPEV